MIRPIMTARFFLRQPAEAATVDDETIARDLAETLEAHQASCVGMAANMIGERKRIICVLDTAGTILTMRNPELLRTDGAYETVEGCLSLPGARKVTRYRRILVAWDDESMHRRSGTFTGAVAQAIQHEIDHCNGVLI